MSLVTCARVGEALTEWLDSAPQLNKDALCEALDCATSIPFTDCAGNDIPEGAALATCAELDELRLPAGTAGQHLVLDAGGNPVWADEPEALPGGGTTGQVLTLNANGDPEWLDVVDELPAGGTDGQHLVIDANGNPIWADDDGKLPDGGTDGQHLVIDASGNAAWADETEELPSGGTDGQVLVINASGEPEWADPADPLPAGGTDGQHLVIDSSGQPAWADETEELPSGGTDGQHLVIDSSGQPAWETPEVFATANSDSVDVSGNGTSASPLTAEVRLDPAVDNQITSSASGLMVEPELPPSTAADEGKLLTVDAAGEPVWEDLPTCLVETMPATGTLTEDDNGKLAVGAGGTVTAPTSLPEGFRIDIVGPATVATPGSTLKSIGGDTKVVADGGATLIKISATEYWLAGALESLTGMAGQVPAFLTRTRNEL